MAALTMARSASPPSGSSQACSSADKHAFGQVFRIPGERPEQDLWWVGGQGQRRPEQALLRAEVVADQRDIDPSLGRDGTHGHRLVAVGKEPSARHLEHLDAGLGPTRSPTTRRGPGFIHHG